MKAERDHVRVPMRRRGLFEDFPTRPWRVSGYWFHRKRHRDSQTSVQYLVPADDPLRYDRLVDLSAPDLDVVPEAADEREVPVLEDHWTATEILLVCSVGAYVMGVALRIGALSLTEPQAAAWWLALVLAVPLWALYEGASAKLACAFVPLVPVAFAVTRLLAGMATGPGRKLAVVVSLCVAALFIDTFTNHAVRVQLGTSVLDLQRRLYFRKLWARRWTVWMPRADWKLTKSEGRARWAIALYSFGFSLAGALYVLTAERLEPQLTTAVVSLGGGFVFLLRPLLSPGPRRLWALLSEAVRSWVEFGTRGSFAPGMMQSPAGARPYRVMLLGLSLTLLAGVFGPPLSSLLTDLREEIGPIGGTGRMIQWIFVSCALGPAVLLGLTCAVSLPVLGALAVICDGRPDQRRAAGWSSVVQRLQTAKLPLHRGQLLFGYHATSHYPILVPRTLASEHIFLSGGSGTGKTSRVLLPLSLQLEGPLLVVDLKGDDVFCHALRDSAEKAGRTFRCFTNRVGYSTHAFNPFAELLAATMPLERASDSLISGLNLEHGTGFGKSFFSAVVRGWLREQLERFPNVRSIAELSHEIGRVRPALSRAERDREEHAYEARLALKMLASIAELNVTEGMKGWEERIDFDRVVRDDEVAYFSLSPKPEEVVARFIGSMAVESFYAALLRRNGSRDERGEHKHTFKKAYAVLDEFQVLAGRNFQAFLEAARSNGLGLILAMQVPEKLEPDLRAVVEENVAIRQYCSSRSADDVQRLMVLGGTTMEISGTGPGGEPRFAEAMRLSANRLREVSGREDHSVLFVHRSVEFAQFDGFPVIVRSPHCQDRDKHSELLRRPWQTGEGLLIAGERPSSPELYALKRGAAAPVSSPRTERPSRGPTVGTELERMFGRIVVTEDGYTVAPDDSSKTKPTTPTEP